MAYISKDEVKAKSIKLKDLNKEYKVKASFSGSNTSTLNLNIHSGSIAFIENYITTQKEIYQYWSEDDTMYVLSRSCLNPSLFALNKSFSGKAKQYLLAASTIMKEGWHDDSDLMTDYFNTAWYNQIYIGQWDKPYKVKLKQGD